MLSVCVSVCLCVCVIEDGRVRDLTLRGVAAHCSQSALWDASVRERVTHSRLSEQVKHT